MRQVQLATMEDLNRWLAATTCYANGKNIPVDHLYPTVAQSRFDYENVLGVYLTKPRFSWMALWMALLNRKALRKRQIEYYPPDLATGDAIGSIGVHLPDPTAVIDEQLFVERAYVHLFSLIRLDIDHLVDLVGVPTHQKVAVLQERGFHWGTHRRRGYEHRALLAPLPQPILIDVDEWQVVLCQLPRVLVDVQLVIEPALVKALAARVKRISHAPSEAYIVFP